MDRTYRRALLATNVRRVFRDLAVAADRAESLYLEEEARELFHLAFQLLEVHRKLVDLAPQSADLSAEEEARDLHGDVPLS